MDFELLFLKSLMLTVLIEAAILIVFFRFIVRLKNISLYRLLFTGFIASFATLPYLWFVLPSYIEQNLWYMVIGESFAVLMETVIIGAMLRTTLLKSFLCSLVCNMISFLIGLIVF